MIRLYCESIRTYLVSRGEVPDEEQDGHNDVLRYGDNI